MNDANKEILTLLTQDSPPEQAFSVLIEFSSNSEDLVDFQQNYQEGNKELVKKIAPEELKKFIKENEFFKADFLKQWNHQRNKELWGIRNSIVALREAAVLSASCVSSNADIWLKHGFGEGLMDFTGKTEGEITDIKEKAYCVALYFQYFFRKKKLVP